MDRLVALSLDAVVVAVTNERPRILTVPVRGDRLAGLPSGPLLDEDETLELGVRRWIREQAGIEVGYVEQLYTFGDRSRLGGGDPRAVAAAYVALIHEEQPAPGAAWLDCYELLPWEDQRAGPPEVLADVRRALERWTGTDRHRQRRAAEAFGSETTPWDGIRVLERYELLYEAELVAEAFRDRGVAGPDGLPTGAGLALDHRRIVATALGRLRGKLTYRPVVFELLPEEFTLLALQQTVEALAGVGLHKQNFRRLVERTRLVEGTGRLAESTGGRRAELFRFRPEVTLERPRPGTGVPW